HGVGAGRDVALAPVGGATPRMGPGRFGRWATEPVAVCAVWWRWQAGTARRDGRALGPASYREICYEALVAEPTDVLDDVAAFLGLPPSPAMAQYHDGRVRDGPGLSAKQAWL